MDVEQVTQPSNSLPEGLSPERYQTIKQAVIDAITDRVTSSPAYTPDQAQGIVDRLESDRPIVNDRQLSDLVARILQDHRVTGADSAAVSLFMSHFFEGEDEN